MNNLKVDVISLLETMQRYCKGEVNVSFSVSPDCQFTVHYWVIKDEKKVSQTFCYCLGHLKLCKIPASEILFKDFERFVRSIR